MNTISTSPIVLDCWQLDVLQDRKIPLSPSLLIYLNKQQTTFNMASEETDLKTSLK